MTFIWQKSDKSEKFANSILVCLSEFRVYKVAARSANWSCEEIGIGNLSLLKCWVVFSKTTKYGAVGCSTMQLVHEDGVFNKLYESWDNF